MMTWRKLTRWVWLVLPNIIAGAIPCCEYQVELDSIEPPVGDRGTDVQVVLYGRNFAVCPDQNGVDIMIDGTCGGSAGQVQTDCTVTTSYTDTEIPLTLHISPNARLGAHSIAVFRGNIAASFAREFIVTCPTCPTPPYLFDVTSLSPLVPGGPPVTFQFTGVNFYGHSPQAVIDDGGITFPAGNPTVYTAGGTDWFFLDLTADVSVRPGIHAASVITDGGSSNSRIVWVDASQPPPSPTPGGPPVLNSITPTHISQAAGSMTATVAVKCEGSGFGIDPQMVVDPNNTIGLFAELPTHQANPDQVVVGLTAPFPGGTDTSVTVHVLNTQTGMTSNGLILHVDPPFPGAPFAQDPGGFAVRRNGHADFTMFGQNLQGVIDQSFSGIPLVWFSNVQPNPNYPPGTAIDFQVHADAGAPLSGDEATNLIITTPNGRSNPLFLDVMPQ